MVKGIDRLTEEGTKRGHKILRVRYNDCSLAIKNNNPQVIFRGEKLENIDAVIPWIIQGEFHYGLDVINQFESMGVFVTNGSQAFNIANNKWRTAQILAKKGINTPDTFFSNNTKSMNDYIGIMHGQNIIIKILDEWATKGRGVLLADSKLKAETIVCDLEDNGKNCIIQEFIEESRGTDIRAYVVSNQVVASMQRKAKEGEYRSNLHAGGSGKPIQLTDAENQLVVAASGAVGLSTAGVDIMRTKRGPAVIELNASGDFGIEEVTGVNVANKIIEFIENSCKAKNNGGR